MALEMFWLKEFRELLARVEEVKDRKCFFRPKTLEKIQK